MEETKRSYREIDTGVPGTNGITVLSEEVFKHHAPHNFLLIRDRSKEECGADEVPDSGPHLRIHFQEGPVKEYGINGVDDASLLNMILCRLQHFQDSPYACDENAMAIVHIENAMSWLRIRTEHRERRGAEGTSKI